MSLYGSIQIASNSLQAQQIGLQVVAQNIANANTPGYSRSEVLFSPAPTQRQGSLLLGLGVQVEGVVQKIDELLNQRLRGATSDRVSSETQQQAFSELEGIVGELSSTDLSTSLNNFFSKIAQILDQPESVTVRNLAVLQGRTLAGDITRLANRVAEVRADLNQRITVLDRDINRLAEEIAGLNIRIAATEGGDATKSDAVGLRDSRNLALTELAQLVNIHVAESTSGAANVFIGGDFLVFEGTTREVANQVESDGEIPLATLKFVETDSVVQATSGLLAGLTVARDQIAGDFLEQLDGFAATLIFEFNKLFASGQGLKGHTSLSGEFRIDDSTVALDQAGLPFTPVNGAFQVKVIDTQTGLSQTTEISVDLNGLDGDDTTLADLTAALDAISGLSATINSTGNLVLASESPIVEFAFAEDSSGVLAALGLNTFFTGSEARTMGVSQFVIDDPAKFAASRAGVDSDTANAEEMAAFLDRPLDTANGSTLGLLYDQLIGAVTQGSTVAKAVAEGFRVFEETLEGQQLAVSGVNLDEEAVRMISFQRAYQASARYITVVDELLQLLVSL